MGIQGNRNAGVTRREALGIGGGVALSLTALGGSLSAPFVKSVLAGETSIDYSGWEDLYRKEWHWDGVYWGSHNNQCMPASCAFRVYTRNGMVWREEQAAKSDASSDEYPDFNPLGCQKGCSFHHALTSLERMRYPLKRAGERGEGKWQRISWDQAIGEIADAILDGHETSGPSSFVIDAPHVHAGTVAFGGAGRLVSHLGGIMPDTNVAIGDDMKGVSHVFGKMRHGSTSDNFFDAELIVMTHSNWAYTAPPLWHFITEARYNGTEVAILAPDYNPSCVAADIHVPVKPASDAAFWMSIAQVMISDGTIDTDFVIEQTDMPILVRTDTDKFLSAAEVDGGRPNQFYFHNSATGDLAQASRGTLALEIKPQLEGAWDVTLMDGQSVRVETVFSKLRRLLNKTYTPEEATKLCGVSPSLIRSMAGKIATKVTHAHIGYTSAKHYHGDLMERALILCLGLSGNWGKPGTGVSGFFATLQHLEIFPLMDTPVKEGGLQPIMAMEHGIEEALKKADPDTVAEDVSIEVMIAATKAIGVVPPAHWMYNQVGYKELWDRKEWQDPATGKTFGEYLQEAIDKKYIDPAFMAPDEDKPTQVYMMMAHNPLRRARSGRSMYAEKFFPKTKMSFAIETRMSTSAAFADIVLPAAWYYEKDDLTSSFVLSPFNVCQQKAVNPPGEAKPEWEMFRLLTEQVAARAAKRGMTTFTDHAGTTRNYADIPARFTMNGRMKENKDVVREFIDVDVALGIYPPDYDYDKFAKDGTARITGLGIGVQASGPGNDVSRDRPLFSFGWHVDKKYVYPTQTRRAQFYMDHDWFIEAGEAFPVHKDTPPVGGNHPFRIISGHPRISVHTLHQAVPFLMKLHRSQPVVFMNDEQAEMMGIKDGDMVRVFNDLDSSELMAALSAGVGPDQVVIYMFEPYQFKDWKSHDVMLVGLPKPTHLAMDYPQLRYYSLQGSPAPTTDRALRVNVEKV